MQMGLGADDLVAAVPLLARLAEIEAETVSRVGSHSLSFDQIHALAAKIRGAEGRRRRRDARHRHAGGDQLPARPAARTRHAGDRDGGDAQSRRSPRPTGRATCSPPCASPADPWVRAHARALGVMAVMLDEVYAAADVLKVHPTRLNAFASTQTGPLAALVEDRVVPLTSAGARCHRSRRASICARRGRQGAAGGAALDVARRVRPADRGDARGVPTVSAIAAR